MRPPRSVMRVAATSSMIFERVRVAFKRAGDREVAQGPEADMHHFGRLFRAEIEVVGVGEDLACATDAHAVMREVQRRQGDVLTEDVIPHIEFRPIVERGRRGSARREHACR